jgi:Tfp pilus assembly protein PilE
LGQQQLLLIVLGVIIVGIAIAVGITMFRSNTQSSNRDQLISDLERLAVVAQEYYKKPVSMAGGADNFRNFALSAIDTGNADGSFKAATSPPNDADPMSGSMTPISTSTQEIYIIGYGKELGNNNRQAVKAYAAVTPDSMYIKIMN